MRVFDFNSAIVRTPAPTVINGLRAEPGPPPDFATLQHEHSRYVAALTEAGLRVTVLDALEQFPDSIFVEDPALVFGDSAILLRPGAPSRLAESRELLSTLSARFARVLELDDGFADGGDILVTPREVLIGLSARTDQTGARHLQRLLASLGRASRVVSVPRGTLHLNTDCSLIDEETVLATEVLAASGELKAFRILTMPAQERGATNALRLNETVLVRAGCPRTQDLLAHHGVNPVALPVEEIAKIDAGLSCMSLRWFDANLQS